MSKATTPQIQLIELAYQIERGSQQWLSEIGSILRESIPGVISCYAFEVSRAHGHFVLDAQWAEDEVVAVQMARVFAEAPSELLNLFHRAPLIACTAGEVLGEAGMPMERTLLRDVFDAMGITDQFAVAALGPSGRGTVLGMCLDNHKGPPPEQRVMLSQIGAHVAAGARLQHKLRGAPAVEHAAAILQPDGKLEHGTSEGVAARALIGEAIRRVEQARASGTDPREALELWQGLVDGRWSLVDHFEGSGRRYYVAVENSPEAAKAKTLARREAEVIAYLASGTPIRETAYALGIGEGTIRGYLRTAMAKLGVRSRAELIGLRASLLGSEQP